MALASLTPREGLNSPTPPDPQTRLQNNPTLLTSWWATAFALVIILVRVVGRYIRTEELFREDKVMIASIVPLLARMAFIHVVLLWGTNNTKITCLSEAEILQREIGSRLVLVARILYAIFIWMAKYTVLEFLRRLTGAVWRRSFQIMLQFIQYFLALTLIAVIIATLGECQPFDHYWQVVPDPGPQCRLGYANLITMGACDIITDLLLVAFPIPLILSSSLTLKRKVSLILLFGMSLILVAMSLFRVLAVIQRDGVQGYRSLLASLEILASAAVSNAIVIGSFIRDRGVKKQKFKKTSGSTSGSENVDHSSIRRANNVAHHQWGSDVDLAGDVGICLRSELQPTDPPVPRPAPVAFSNDYSTRTGAVDPHWNSDAAHRGLTSNDRGSISEANGQASSREHAKPDPALRQSNTSTSHRRVSFFDVVDEPSSRLRSSTPRASNCPIGEPSITESPRHSRGSRAFLQDVGGLLSPHRDNPPPQMLSGANSFEQHP